MRHLSAFSFDWCMCPCQSCEDVEVELDANVSCPERSPLTISKGTQASDSQFREQGM
ncbi:hypothetical protein M3J09_006589 [Ascochyta lentis]